ncbi:leucine-rich repeat protein [bacterium]|nr:leucine-rich repeat protein [bacterium]
MARKYYGKIDKHTDWGGDESTGGLRVSGRSVQDFLRESLDGKAGLFHYDASNNRYMVFADEEAKDLYMADPAANKDLLLANFDAPFNYEAHITLLSEQFVPLLAGSTGNYIEFTFDTVNKSGQSVGEDVVCTYTFQRGSVRKTLTQKYRRGTRVRLNIDKYIETGQNDITIGIVGQQTLAATTVGVTVQVVDLRLSDEFDIAAVVEETGAGARIEVPYSIGGYGAKRLEWYLDGVLLPYVASEDEVTETETSRIKYISVEGLRQGTHSLQFRAYTEINGERFYSRMLYREFMVYDHSNMDPLIAVATEFPLNAPVIGEGETLKLYGVTQYLTYPLKLAVFNPTYASSTPLRVYLDGALQTTLSMQNDKEVTHNLVVTSAGEHTLRLETETTTYEIAMDVEKSSTTVEEITQGLFLSLSAMGKSNSASDRDVWEFGTYRTQFSNFQWLPTCGWNDGELVISGGASISVNCAPLGEDSTTNGKTLEFEFATRNVVDIDAVICDLRNANGVGILITASEASLISAGGAKVSTRYKTDELVRLSFVVNRKQGTAEKCLVYMYVNGILSGAASYAVNDNFLSAKTITISSTEDAEITLQSMRFYTMALSANQILNNYILYRPNVKEFLSVYDRNNIYTEGTTEFSTDALSGQLPIMIVTGNIPALEATTDKNLQIDVDVEYINLQDPTRSFKLKDGAMRPQGTSSMSYPKKNFRLYTNKKDSTVLYDSEGNEVKNRLYSFKSGAQPVDCWCLKADVAESSGTHNTGIARLWNDVMKNAQIEGEYKCRTAAQQLAIDNGYPYDVRTAIDGFPILIFYRLTENDPLVFIGKYNFNNDKSTESVFGFRDIPGFDNSRMQCWEVLNNGHHLALLTDTNNWNAEWADAFEGRYPDGSTNTTDLKTFATWMSSVSQSNFASEKWTHLDVYKTAAYYVYLMRFGAVDQVVKNAMFTSEDGEHWYYINYDNDTINALRNDGLLIYPPTIDRQTLDTSFSTEVYAYAGHESRLWNMLEGDAEFMRIVQEVDQALYTAGLSYANVIKMFDDEQSSKWCERIYNQDAQYKYISPYTDRGINNLFMLQGSRQSHRRWWLSERFALLDAKWVSGEYKANSFEVKLAGAPIGLTFSIATGIKTYYGYGVNNVPIQYGIELSKGDSHTFTTTSVLNVGDPLRIYAAPYLEEIDISNFAPYLTQISIANVYSERLGTKLRTLKLGKSGVTNSALNELSGINQAIGLQHLDISGFKGLLTLDLTRNTKLESIVAKDSGLTSVVLPAGAPLKDVQLPATLQALSLEGLYYLTDSTLTIQDNGVNLTSVRIMDCPELGTQRIVENWLTYKAAEDEECELEANDVNWTGIDPEWLIRLGKLRKLSLKGMIAVTEVSEEQLTTLQGIFGKNCFSSSSELYIKVPASKAMYFIGPDSVRALSSAKYELIVTSEIPGEASFEIEGVYDSTRYSLNNGVLSVGDLLSDTSITLIGKFKPVDGLMSVVRKTVSLIKINYPTSLTLQGATEIFKKSVIPYTLTIGKHDEDASFRIEWTLTGDAANKGLMELGTTNETMANVVVKALEESSCVLTAKALRNSDDRVLYTRSLTIKTYVGNIILTRADNPTIMSICYQQGWAANPAYMTEEEASEVTDIKGAFQYCSAASFNEFIHFINCRSDLSYDAFGMIGELTVPFEACRTFFNNKIVHYPNLVKIENLNAAQYTTLDRPTLIDAPKLQEIIYAYTGAIASAKHIFLRNIEELKLESLTRLYGVNFNLEICKKLQLPALREWDSYIYRTTTSLVAPELEELELGSNNGAVTGKFYLYEHPLLKKAFLANTSLTVNSFANEDFNALTELTAPFATSASGTMQVNSLETLNLPMVKTFSAKLQSTSLKSLSIPLVETFGADATIDTPALESSLSVLENVKKILCTQLFPQGYWTGKDVSFPNLEELNESQILKEIHSIDAPKLKTLKYGTVTFKGNSIIEEINLPSLTSIFRGIFQDCTSLKNILIAGPNDANCYGSVNGDSTSPFFGGCSALESITLTETLKIYNEVFIECNVKKISLPKAVHIGGDYYPSFKDLPNLSEIDAPLCQELRGYVVENCPSLEELVLPECTLLGEVGVSARCYIENVKRLTLSITKPVTAYLYTGLEAESLEEINAAFSSVNKYVLLRTHHKLHTINLYAMTLNGSLLLYNNNKEVGTEAEGDKTIHVPTDSTIYDDNDSIKKLLDEGWTLVKDLPNNFTTE